MAPLPCIEPGGPIASEDAVTQTLPYLPGWPELAAIYNAPTLTISQALSGGSNLVLIGQPGVGKTVAVAHLASLAANRNEMLGGLKGSHSISRSCCGFETAGQRSQETYSILSLNLFQKTHPSLTWGGFLTSWKVHSAQAAPCFWWMVTTN